MNSNKAAHTAREQSQGLSKATSHAPTQTSGISVANLTGGLYLNLTQPECTDEH